MKVPHQIVGNTRPSAAGMDPLRVQVDPDAFGASIGTGLQQLAQGLQVKAKQAEQRTEKLDRFQSMSNFSDFEIMVNGRMAELKKTADPTGKGFTEAANSMYDKAADEFIAKMVPEDMKMEARYWTSNTRQRIIGDAMGFQYEAGNAYFRAGVDKQYQSSLKSLDPKLGGDPTRLPAEKQRLADFIATTDLSEIEKQEMLRTTSVGLEGVVYKQAKKVEMATGGGGVKGLIRKEEGFRTEPYWDVNAWRIGYGSDTITRADGSVVKVQPGMTVTRDDAERDLERRVTTEFMPKAANQIGPQAWGALGDSAKAALASVAYNYGSLPNSVVNAAKTGNLESLASSVAALSSNKDRRQREAAMIRSNSAVPGEIDIDSNPLFANLPYEDRVALSKDADSEFAAEQKAQAEAYKLQVDTQINNLLNKINDGVAGQTEINAARAEGWLSDYGDISRAQDLYEKRNAEVLSAQRGLELAAGLRTADPTSEEDRKSLNAVVGKGGLSRLDGMDAAYLTNGIVPLVTQSGDIPTDVAGLLFGMMRSNNQQKALFALDALAMLQDADDRAFKNRVPDDVEADVNFYRMRRSALPADELFTAVNGGRTPQERQGRTLLYQEAQDILKAKDKGVSSLSTMVQEVTSGFDGWTASAQQLSVPAFAKQLSFDYESAFTDAYVKYGDLDAAKKAASDFINNQWGVTSAGGTLMRNPPEKAGYPQVMGSYDWIDRQARELLQLPEGSRYELISDDKTASEIAAAKRGGPPPSYQVVTIDEFGTPRLKMFDTEVGGKGDEMFISTDIPARISFQKTQQWVEAEEHDLDAKTIDAQLKEVVQEMMSYQGMESEMPPELQKEYDDLQTQKQFHMEEREKLAPKYNRPAPAPVEGLMKGRTMRPIGLDLLRSVFENK